MENSSLSWRTSNFVQWSGGIQAIPVRVVSSFVL